MFPSLTPHSFDKPACLLTAKISLLVNHGQSLSCSDNLHGTFPPRPLPKSWGFIGNIPVGPSLEVGGLTRQRPSPLGSFCALKARKPARLPFRRGADSHNMQLPFTFDDSRVARLLGLIATENGAAESSTFHMSNERATTGE